MAIVRDRPYGNAHFSVDLGDGEARSFLEALLPEMIITYQEFREGNDPQNARKAAMYPRFSNLILRRGFTGDLSLYQWWQAVADGQNDQRRSLTVNLLSEDRTVVVASWRISNAFPVRYSVAPLDGCDGGVLVETLELTCEGVRME